MYKGEQIVTPATIRAVNFLTDPQGLGFAEVTVIEKAGLADIKPFGYSVKMPEVSAPAASAAASDMQSLLIWIVVVVVIIYLASKNK